MADHTDGDGRGETQRPEEAPGRKPYRSPKLTVYGDLPRLVAMAKPGSRGDGSGQPKTKL